MNFIQNRVDFCLDCSLATVAAYIRLFQEKPKQGEDGGRGVEQIIFLQNHWKFSFVTLPQEISDKMKLHP